MTTPSLSVPTQPTEKMVQIRCLCGKIRKVEFIKLTCMLGSVHKSFGGGWANSNEGGLTKK